MLNLLSNNDGNLATSNTAGVSDEIIEELRQGCHEVLDLLVPTFDYLEAMAAYQILEVLAKSPISLMRCAGKDWNQIDMWLKGHLPKVSELDMDQIDYRLMRHIELVEWGGQASQETWQWYAARELYIPPQTWSTGLKNCAPCAACGGMPTGEPWFSEIKYVWYCSNPVVSRGSPC